MMPMIFRRNSPAWIVTDISSPTSTFNASAELPLSTPSIRSGNVGSIQSPLTILYGGNVALVPTSAGILPNIMPGRPVSPCRITARPASSWRIRQISRPERSLFFRRQFGIRDSCPDLHDRIDFRHFRIAAQALDQLGRQLGNGAYALDFRQHDQVVSAEIVRGETAELSDQRVVAAHHPDHHAGRRRQWPTKSGIILRRMTPNLCKGQFPYDIHGRASVAGAMPMTS